MDWKQVKTKIFNEKKTLALAMQKMERYVIV